MPPVMYRLAVPTAALAATFAVVTNADALDCAKAATAPDRAICATDYVREANAGMESAYAELRGKLTPRGREVLLAGQRNWLGYRDARCGVEGECLADESGLRREALQATPAGMAPFFIWRPGAPGEFAVRIEGYRFSDPGTRGEHAYNAWVDGVVAATPLWDAPDEAAVRDSEEAGADASPPPWSYDVAISVATVSPRLASALAFHDYYSGGAHGGSRTANFAFDPQDGALRDAWRFLDMAHLDAAIRDCGLQIVAAQSDVYGGMEPDAALDTLERSYPDAVRTHIGDMKHWSFSAEGLTVMFDRYAVGPYVAGEFDCLFGWDRLQALVPDIARRAASR